LSMCCPTTTSGISPFFTDIGSLHSGQTGTWLSCNCHHCHQFSNHWRSINNQWL